MQIEYNNNLMEEVQNQIQSPISPIPLNKDYLILQHQYITLTHQEEPVSIHSVALPFITNAIFNTKTNHQSIYSHTKQLLQKIRNVETIVLQAQSEDIRIEDMDFEIGDREEKEEVVRIGLKKGMKSLANVKKLADMGGNYFSNLINKRK